VGKVLRKQVKNRGFCFLRSSRQTCTLPRDRQAASLPAGETLVTVTHYLDLTPKWVDGTAVGGCSFMIHVRHAAAALSSYGGDFRCGRRWR